MSVAASSSRYSDTAGRAPPATSENRSIAAGGSIVILYPGMYAVDSRSRASASIAEPGWNPSAGAAM